MDSIIIDIVQGLVDLQCAAAPDDGPGSPLRASTFSAITAAFATQGYWVQADVLDKLMFSDLQLWAPLLYVLAVIGGLVGVALGAPPKTYMWFFMGPAIYSWLIGTHIDVKGVRWAMPCVGNPQVLRNFQGKVWELSEVGLANSNAARILGPTAAGISKSAEPRAWVSVSAAFLWFDELVSSTIINMMRWTGLYNLEAGQGGGDTNLPELPSIGTQNLPVGVLWSLYADVKWQALEEITSASVDNPDFRDAFSNFFVMCGDALRKSFNTQAMMAAMASGGRRLPPSVMTCASDDTCDQVNRSYNGAGRNLRNTIVSVPSSLGNVVRTGLGSLQQNWPGSSLDATLQLTEIDCEHYLFLLMQALRLEAAFKYHGLWNSVGPEFIPEAGVVPGDTEREEMLISSLFYGWDIRRDREWTSAFTVGTEGELLTLPERQRFAYNLILLHLFRNEYMITKEITPIRQTNEERTQQNVELALKTTSAKSKFSELYTWSLLLPYIQGTLLYFLAVAYPFACVLVVVPGWHKAVFTWMSFWAWAKMWDLGFAIVKALERSIWAMTSQGGNVKFLSDRIVRVDELVGEADWVGCSGSALCPIPLFSLVGPSGTVNLDYPSPASQASVNEAWQLFDQSLLMSKALNLDLANSYYIYIMAALYMAIPAVTGQLVLGARSGASSMVNSMIGGVASDAGRAASSGYQGDLSMKLRSNAATIGQSSEAKAMAKQGFAAQALGYSVKQLEEGRAASEAQAASGAITRILGQSQNAMSMREGAARLAESRGNLVNSGLTKDAPELWRGDPGAGPSGSNGAGGGAGGGGGSTRGNAARSLGKGFLSEELARSGYEAGQDFYGASNQYAQQQAGLDMRAFQANANSSQLGAAQGNMRSYADFSAKQEAWHERNAFANQVGGWSAALGIQTGNVDPGSKPSDMVGFAMSGQLGQTAKGSAWHLDWNKSGEFGGHRGGTNAIHGGLNDNYGASAVKSAYHSWTPTDAATALAPDFVTKPAHQAQDHGLLNSSPQVQAGPNSGLSRMRSSGANDAPGGN